MEWFARINNDSNNHSPLLKLPAELREHIFSYVLVCPRTVVTFHLEDFQRDAYQEAVPPALTQVSRQIRHETLPLWYKYNKIILHTEASKGDDSRYWLTLFESHLPLLCKVEFWLRYVTILRDRTGSQGILAIRMSRPPCEIDGWNVVHDGWRWVTVVRKPDTLANDARFLLAKINRALQDQRLCPLTRDKVWALIVELRDSYGKFKVDRLMRFVV